ncbi:hypothetical protein RHMOL_Rhmol06G0128200 [Rhododendron molle]|uniref:Uncharacterized protein n=1 Tax=Rhododendron molle TaxID=49168 RepID=A0ACC0NBU1_RHOML|nr:hypothetical protein RHMOL_Rhmol06G0128200 [Rhododendron molle]
MLPSKTVFLLNVNVTVLPCFGLSEGSCIIAKDVGENDAEFEEGAGDGLTYILSTDIVSKLDYLCLEEDFNGKAGQSIVLRLSGIGSKRVGLTGLGQSASATAAYWSLGESVAVAAKASQASNVAIVIASPEGLSAESKLNTASAIVSGVLAEEASKIASMYSDVISATILDVEQCKELKMGSYLGVVAASENPPDFIHLCYKPSSGPVKAKLALVGKGLTFDRLWGSLIVSAIKKVLSGAQGYGEYSSARFAWNFFELEDSKVEYLNVCSTSKI